MRNGLRLIVGFVLAPLITPVVILGFASLRAGRIDLQSFPLFVLLATFAYGAAIFFGAPALLLYWKLGLRNPFWFVIGGALIGVMVTLLLSIWLGWGSLKFSGVYVLAASLSAAIFRLLIGRDQFEGTGAAPK